MKKNYNYTRRRLFLPEYGRHIHEMIDSLMLIEDRYERNRQARAVIAVMGNLNPLLRDTADFTHKLWDHLFIMSDFQLDGDSPYPRPTIDNLARYMRTKSYEYNQEHPNNEVIVKDLKQMSDGTIEINEEALNNLRSDYKQHFSARQGKQQRNHPQQKNRNQQHHANFRKNGTPHRNSQK